MGFGVIWQAFATGYTRGRGGRRKSATFVYGPVELLLKAAAILSVTRGILPNIRVSTGQVTARVRAGSGGNRARGGLRSGA